jgi:hypothetical protein
MTTDPEPEEEPDENPERVHKPPLDNPDDERFLDRADPRRRDSQPVDTDPQRDESETP